jgi:hypothetical protein
MGARPFANQAAGQALAAVKHVDAESRASEEPVQRKKRVSRNKRQLISGAWPLAVSVPIADQSQRGRVLNPPSAPAPSRHPPHPSRHPTPPHPPPSAEIPLEQRQPLHPPPPRCTLTPGCRHPPPDWHRSPSTRRRTTPAWRWRAHQPTWTLLALPWLKM